VYFTKVDEGILDELDIVYLIDNIFSAGTAAALANNPQVQYKAHQELDQVIGYSHLSNVSDELNMSYICAIIKKSQRYCGPVYVGAELEGISRPLWYFKIENALSLIKDSKTMSIDLEKVLLGIIVWPEEYRIKFIKKQGNIEKILFDK
ncbi:3980_t:CDS:2, partial [Gigaspora rosea]